jgi:hypothetical protein
VRADRAPITRYMRRISRALERASHGDASHLTLSGLVDLMGSKAHRLLLLVVSLLNMIPGPPGFGGLMAITTALIALALLFNNPIQLPPLIGERKLRLKVLVRASKQVVRVAGILARFSRPRIRWLTGAIANVPYAILVLVVCPVLIIPIPFTNAIPNLGLCIIAFSMLNRDGVGIIAGAGITLLGLVIDVALITFAVRFGMGMFGFGG